MQDAKEHNVTLQAEGLLSVKVQATTVYLEEAVKEMETIMAEALPEFEPQWSGGSNGGFLAPCNGACMTKGPLTNVELFKSPTD